MDYSPSKLSRRIRLFVKSVFLKSAPVKFVMLSALGVTVLFVMMMMSL